MEVMRLEFVPEIKEELLKILGSFSPDELKITFEDSLFEKDKKRLQASDDKILDQEFPL
ncbi:hypothetical protein CLU81_4416 [Flavobacterium sp. 9]|uniref:hypothetical protein n=1 Tax=Flavobacterium sp. 9 TaxID=2035198 RepID=UPI000C46EF32|nr:hypothetical protein [Flavobacterium sp. 9]PIF33791.1 hypothetical protein CLU81_4416 [Flavobacterium sp. 9]